uniref:Uncharacterized protein n=1 Tax=Anguilla anguilla TaxID=7936 RepID=A0A0E9REF6_ANGAN
MTQQKFCTAAPSFLKTRLTTTQIPIK